MDNEDIEAMHEYYVNFLSEQLTYYNELKREYENSPLFYLHNETSNQLLEEYKKICRNLSLIDILYGFGVDALNCEDNLFFTYFRALFDVLSVSDCTPFDKLLIISKYVQINVSSAPNKKLYIDITHLDEFNFYYFNAYQIRAMIKSGQLFYRLSKPSSKKTLEDKLLLIDITRYSKAHPVNVAEMVKLNQDFIDHFVNKYPRISLEDIGYVSKFLHYFNVRTEDVREIENMLMKTHFRYIQKAANNTSNIINFGEKPRDIDEEVATSFVDGQFVKPLAYGKLLEMIAAMIDRGSLSDEIVKVIDAWYEYHHKNNPIANFFEDYPRYVFYAEKLSLTDDLNFLNELASMIFICSDEDYAMIRDYMAKELKRFDKLIAEKWGYTFEFKVARLVLESK